MAVHTCDSNTWEMHRGVAEIPGYPGLHREFEVNLVYMVL